ncbi:hypothetical protein BH10ACT2_BH10ACT2_28480 [soil metagenome]
MTRTQLPGAIIVGLVVASGILLATGFPRGWNADTPRFRKFRVALVSCVGLVVVLGLATLIGRS